MTQSSIWKKSSWMFWINSKTNWHECKHTNTWCEQQISLAKADVWDFRRTYHQSTLNDNSSRKTTKQKNMTESLKNHFKLSMVDFAQRKNILCRINVTRRTKLMTNVIKESNNDTVSISKKPSLTFWENSKTNQHECKHTNMWCEQSISLANADVWDFRSTYH